MTVPVYTQENTTDVFLYTTGLPAMERFSVCFWMFGVPDDDDRKEDALFSIAVPGQLFKKFNSCGMKFNRHKYSL